MRHAETGRPVAQIIHNFGRVDELDRQTLARLCKSIARVCGLDVQDPIERHGETKKQEHSALPEGVRLLRTLELGAVLTIEALWERLGIGPILHKAMEESGAGVVYERALLAMTPNRLCKPESKLGVWDRWLSKVYMPSCAGIKLGQMYEAMDLFHWHIRKVEDTVFFQTANLFKLAVDLIFHDTTTASFSIDEEDEDNGDIAGLRKYGHSKSGHGARRSSLPWL